MSARRRRSYSAVTASAPWSPPGGNLARDLGDGHGVPKAEIEPLGADRRKHVGGFSDQGDPVRGRALGGRDHEREGAMARLDLDLSEDRVAAPLDLGVERSAAQLRETLGLARRDHAHDAGAVSGQRHDREGAVLGMKFRRNIMVRPGVAHNVGQRSLRRRAFADRNPRRLATERMAPVGADRERDLERARPPQG